MSNTVKIVVIGPESTGKSTLTKQLAVHFNAPYIPEFAREYLEARPGIGYELQDIENIAQEQLARTNFALAAKPKLLFCDTDFLTLHIWTLDKFSKPIPFIEKNLQAQKADLYLLCAPDIAWQADPLREDSTRRNFLLEWNIQLLESLNAIVELITGEGETRFLCAKKTVEKFLE